MSSPSDHVLSRHSAVKPLELSKVRTSDYTDVRTSDTLARRAQEVINPTDLPRASARVKEDSQIDPSKALVDNGIKLIRGGTPKVPNLGKMPSRSYVGDESARTTGRKPSSYRLEEIETPLSTIELDETSDLRLRIEDQLEEIEALRARLLEAARRASEQSSRIAQEEDTIRSLRAENEALQEAERARIAKEAEKAREKMLSEEAERLNVGTVRHVVGGEKTTQEIIQDLRNQVKNLTRERDEAKTLSAASARPARKTAASKDDEMEKLKKEFERYKEKSKNGREARQAEVLRIQTENNGLKAALKEAGGIEGLRDLLGKRDERLVASEAARDKYFAELTVERTANEALRAKIKQQEDANKTELERMRLAQAELRESKAREAALQAKLTKKVQELEGLKEEKARENEEKERARSEKAQALEDKNKTISEQNASIEAINTRLSVMEAEKANLIKQSEEALAGRDKALKDLEKAKQRIERRTTRANQAITDLRGELEISETAMRALEAKKAATEGALAASLAKEAELQQSLKLKTEELKRLKEEKDREDEEKEKAKGAKDAETAQILTDKDKVISDLEKEVAQLRARIEQQEQIIADQRQQINDFKTQIRTLNSALERSQSETSSVLSELSQQRSQFSLILKTAESGSSHSENYAVKLIYGTVPNHKDPTQKRKYRNNYEELIKNLANAESKFSSSLSSSSSSSEDSSKVLWERFTPKEQNAVMARFNPEFYDKFTNEIKNEDLYLSGRAPNRVEYQPDCETALMNMGEYIRSKSEKISHSRSIVSLPAIGGRPRTSFTLRNTEHGKVVSAASILAAQGGSEFELQQ